MQLTRALPVIGFVAIAAAAAIACSDSGSTAPDAARTSVATTGTDSTTTSPGNPTPPAPRPDTGTQVKPSSDPRPVAGTVIAIGPAADTSKYEHVAGATLVVSVSADSTTGNAGTEVARATSAADGSFSFPGTFKIGVYMIVITPPAGSPYAAKQWPFRITEYSSAKVDLTVWLNRK